MNRVEKVLGMMLIVAGLLFAWQIRQADFIVMHVVGRSIDLWGWQMYAVPSLLASVGCALLWRGMRSLGRRPGPAPNGPMR